MVVVRTSLLSANVAVIISSHLAGKCEVLHSFIAATLVWVISLLAQKHSENVCRERSWNVFMESFLNVL